MPKPRTFLHVQAPSASSCAAIVKSFDLTHASPKQRERIKVDAQRQYPGHSFTISVEAHRVRS